MFLFTTYWNSGMTNYLHINVKNTVVELDLKLFYMCVSPQKYKPVKCMCFCYCSVQSTSSSGADHLEKMNYAVS